VGLVTGVCLARVGNNVICVDVDRTKIAKLQEGNCPIYEPQLKEYLRQMIEVKRISFVTDAEFAIKNSDIIMIAVGTPPTEDGSADLKYVLQVAQTIGAHINGYKVIVTKSTVPPGTGRKVNAKIAYAVQKAADYDDGAWDVVSNPEFLKEGSAVNDFLKPDRIIIGTDSERARVKMESLYRPFMRSGYKVIFMSRISAEVTKYAANTMLASRISLMNEIARVSEGVGADIEEIRQGIGSDSRIGKQFLYAGPGYGGSCFPKDVVALEDSAERVGANPILLKAINETNIYQRTFFAQKIKSFYNDDLRGKIFAVWGLAFKADTDDVRESPAIMILETLLQCGAHVAAYDPEAITNFSAFTEIGKHKSLRYEDEQYATLRGADALIILTEWPRFRAPDLDSIASILKYPVVFDARNLLDPQEMAGKNFSYISVGRPDVLIK
jgi:UDPglucose 6-dehydrogenase